MTPEGRRGAVCGTIQKGKRVEFVPDHQASRSARGKKHTLETGEAVAGQFARFGVQGSLMSVGLENLRHIVVLMMENRSFDHFVVGAYHRAAELHRKKLETAAGDPSERHRLRSELSPRASAGA